jgi:GNAT superfamily N-acetyltransferase
MDSVEEGTKGIGASGFRLRELSAGERLPAATMLAGLLTSATPERLLAALNDPVARSVAADQNGELVGVGLIEGSAGPLGAAGVHLAVAEAARGQGIGTAIADRLTEYAAERPDLPLKVALRDDAGAGRRFVERYGLKLSAHSVGRSFDLRKVDDFGPDAEQAAKRAGVTIRTTTFGDDHDVAMVLLTDSARGLPSSTGRPVDSSRAAGFFGPDTVVLLAETGDEPAGLTMLTPGTVPGTWHTQVTGVAVAHRSRGVARALKLAGFQYVKSAGGERMETHNDARNEPILALNQSVGMVPATGFWTFVQKESPAAP